MCIISGAISKWLQLKVVQCKRLGLKGIGDTGVCATQILIGMAYHQFPTVVSPNEGTSCWSLLLLYVLTCSTWSTLCLPCTWAHGGLQLYEKTTKYREGERKIFLSVTCLWTSNFDVGKVCSVNYLGGDCLVIYVKPPEPPSAFVSGHGLKTNRIHIELGL